MRSIFALSFFALINASLSVFSQETEPTNSNEVLVCCLRSSSDSVTHFYYVGRSNLPCKVSWQPGQKPFPMDLGFEAMRARTLLATRMQTNDFNLGSIHISPIFRFPNPKETNTAPVERTSEWLVRFTFAAPYVLANLDAVMLLDGSCASEKLRRESVHESFRDSEKPRELTILSDTNTYSLKRETTTRTNPIELVQSPDFDIPLVQWKWGESFPLDLGEGTTKARSCLAPQLEDFVLDQISIWRYLPSKSITRSGGNFLNNSDHWVITYEFGSMRRRPDSDKRDYSVDMLLDGRVLCVETHQN